jgi:hypothetical protein
MPRVNRTPSPKTRRELAAQLLLFAVPYGFVLAMAIRELSRGRPGTLVLALPAVLVLIAGWIGYSAWAIREYLRWSRGIRPAPARDLRGALVRRDVPLPPELLRSPRMIPGWARPRRWVGAVFGAAALLVNAFFALAKDGGFMLRAGLAFTGAVLAIVLPGVVLRRARRRLLQYGTPVVATVSDVASQKGWLWISYDFDTPAGPRTGTTRVTAAIVARRYGGWPRIGDPALVVYDLDALVKSTLWSLPARRERPGTAGARLVHVGLWVFLALAFVVLYQVFSRR